MLTKEAKESILEIQANAALSGHDLGPFEPDAELPPEKTLEAFHMNDS